MVTIGDSFAVIGALFGICFTAWALVMGAALLFQSGAFRAKEAYRTTPWKGLFMGIFVSLTVGIAGLAFLKLPLPGAKLLGMSLLLTLMCFSALGVAGIAMTIADRICALDPQVTRYLALLRATSLLVVAGVFPILGWFLVAPVLFFGSVGYGLKALFGRESATEFRSRVE